MCSANEGGEAPTMRISTHDTASSRASGLVGSAGGGPPVLARIWGCPEGGASSSSARPLAPTHIGGSKRDAQSAQSGGRAAGRRARAHQRERGVREAPRGERLHKLEWGERPRRRGDEPRRLVRRLRPVHGVVQQPRRPHLQGRARREAPRQRRVLRRRALRRVPRVEQIVREQGTLGQERVGVGGACRGRSSWGRR